MIKCLKDLEKCKKRRFYLFFNENPMEGILCCYDFCLKQDIDFGKEHRCGRVPNWAKL